MAHSEAETVHTGPSGDESLGDASAGETVGTPVSTPRKKTASYQPRAASGTPDSRAARGAPDTGAKKRPAAASDSAARKKPAAAGQFQARSGAASGTSAAAPCADAMEDMRAEEAAARAELQQARASVHAEAKQRCDAAKADMRRRVAAARVRAQAAASGCQPVAAAGLATDGPQEVQREAQRKATELSKKFTGRCFALELFAGCMALSGAIAEKGMGLFVPIDNMDGERPWADVDNPVVQAVLLAAIDAGLLWYIHLATPCKLWSGARTTGLSLVPIGVIAFTVMVLERVAAWNDRASQWQRKPMIVSLENPAGSMLFSVPEVESAMKKLGMRAITYSCCAFGACYKKDSVIWTNGPLSALGRQCSDLPPHTHEILEGTAILRGADGKRKKVWKTSLSAAYVPDLCREWAELLRRAAPPGASGHATLLEPDWQTWLLQATGTSSPMLPLPVCPPKFVVPWASAEEQWGKYAHMKRPAAARKRPAAASDGAQDSARKREARD